MARTPEPERLFLFPMAKDPAFLFYPNDFTTGTQFFSNEQVGIYIRLLCAQHQHGRLNEKDMIKICGTYDNDVFSKFIKDENGKWYNQRLEDEMVKRKQYSDSRRNNRKGKKNICESYVQHMENENENINNNINGIKKNPVPKLNDVIIDLAQRTYYSHKRKLIEPFQIEEIYKTFTDLNYKDGTDKPPEDVHTHFVSWIKFQKIEVEELNDFQKQAALLRANGIV